MENQIQKLVEDAEQAYAAKDFERAEKKYVNALYQLDDPETEEYQTIVAELEKCYTAQGNYDGAKECLEELYWYAKKNKNLRKEADFLHQLAVNTRQSEEYDLAAIMCEEELAFRMTHFPDDPVGLAVTYHEAAMISLLQRNPIKSKIYIDKARHYAEKSGDSIIIADVLRFLGDYHFCVKELAKAREHYLVSCDLYTSQNNHEAAGELMKRIQRLDEESQAENKK